MMTADSTMAVDELLAAIDDTLIEPVFHPSSISVTIEFGVRGSLSRAGTLLGPDGPVRQGSVVASTRTSNF